MVMDNGRISEQGTHRSLLESNGAYARLVQAEDLSAATGDSESISNSAEETSEADLPKLTSKSTRYSTPTKEILDKQLVGVILTIGKE